MKDRSKPGSRPKTPQPNGTPTAAPGTPNPDAPAQTATPRTAEEQAQADKQARLAAWKKEREAKKALDGAKAKAMALAGKVAPQPGEFMPLKSIYA